MIASDRADDLIVQLAEQIADTVQPLQIWLFGSRARGDADQWSDVDLLVVLDQAADRRACRIEVSRLADAAPFGTDIVFTTAEQIVRRGRVAGTLLNNALEEGQLIYEQEDAHAATALEWLDVARHDLELAAIAASRMDAAPGFANQTSWMAQQALEKSIKAALFLERIPVPRTHKLRELADLLPTPMHAWTSGMNLHALTYRGLGGRYPDWGPNPSIDEANETLAAAQRFYDQLAAECERRGIAPSPSSE